MKEINAAYEVLSDPEKRRQYDLKLAIKEPTSARPDRHRGNTGHPHHEASPDQAPRHRQYWDPPRYESAPCPVNRQRTSWLRRGLPYAAGVVVLFILLVVILLGTPQTIAEKPVVKPQVSPVIVPQVIPRPVVTAGKTFEDWKSEGDGYVGQGKTWDAIAAYTQALKIRPNASSLWVIQGDLYSTLGYFTNAVTCYDQGLATNPQAGGNLQKKISILSRTDILMDDAELAVRQENYSAAIGIYDDILSVEIRNTNFQKRVLSAKVYALMKAGRVDEATRVSRLIETV
jgi:tetratricopeptide (TPR) repeat protein